MLKLYDRRGTVVDKVHEKISFEQKNWSEKCISFNRQKRKLAINDLEKDFYKLLNNAFYGKTTVNVRNGIRVEFIKNDDDEKNN